MGHPPLQADVPPEAELLEPAAAGVVAFVVVYLLGRWLVVPGVSRLVRARNRENTTIVAAIERYTRLVVLVVAALAAIVAAGYGDVLSGSALVIAALTLALGVAGREVIGDLVSGLFLVADPDFNVGDYIEWSGGQGVVEVIRFRVTRVRTPNAETITVPNTELATSAVTRPFGGDRFRVVVGLEVALEEDLGAVADALREEAAATEGSLEDPAPLVVLEEFGDDGVVLRVQFWVREPRRLRVERTRSAFLDRLHERLVAEGVEVSPAAGRELSGRVEVTRGGPEGG